MSNLDKSRFQMKFSQSPGTTRGAGAFTNPQPIEGRPVGADAKENQTSENKRPKRPWEHEAHRMGMWTPQPLP